MLPEFFKGNRQRLIERRDGGLVIVAAYARLQRSNDSAHSFAQEANFWYLCGIDEPDWMLIIDGAQHQTTLVMPDVSDTHRTFDGGLSAHDARQISGVDSVITADESIPLLRKLSKRHSLVGTIGLPTHSEYFNFLLNPSITRHRQMLDRQFAAVEDVQKDITALRAIKQDVELTQMQRAIDITVKAFVHVRTDAATFRSEYEIESAFTHIIRTNGAAGHAYGPIVAGGANACTLHYSHNSAKLPSRSLVLMDVGASFGGYAADITRTYAHGEPTKRQKQVHHAVESAHHRIVALIGPHLQVDEYQRSVDEIMKEALASIDLASDDAALRRYFPHAISHGLGIDVHDSLGSPKYMTENMVLTVEPGIYIPEERIGVRIEDDILVTARGHTNMSSRLSTGL
jgi:Xaa-Pro aminopeptidase